MSINFDLAHWGTAYFGINNNDPRILLLLNDEKNPIDAGLNLSLPKEEADEKQIPALANTNNKTNNKTNNTITFTNNNQQTVAKNDAESKGEEKIENEVEIKDKEKIESEAKEDKQQANTVLVFEYSSILPKELRHQLEPLLRNIGDPQQAQGLLNYFAQCFINTTIRKPLIYFKKLLILLKKGLLFLTDSDKEPAEKKQEKQKKNQALIDQRLDYHEAWADYQHIKTIIEAEAKDAGCDFDTYVKTSPYQGLWQGVVDKLKNITPLQTPNIATG